MKKRGKPQTRLMPIDPNRKLQPGDHIYSERADGLFTHHGIYVGDGMVIHLQGPAKKLGPPHPCQKCGNKQGEIAKSSLDSFLDGHSLGIYEYGVSVAEFYARKPGTCSLLHSKPAHEVIKTATDLLEGNSEFGHYDLFANNCEDFAVYCKTGKARSTQVERAIIAPAVIGGLGGAPGALVGLTVTAGASLAYGIAKAVTDAKRHSARGHCEN